MQNTITQDRIVAFIFDEVNDEEQEKIIHAINTDEITRGLYFFEKRKYDIERYLNNEMSIGERLELEELLMNTPLLNEHFVWNNKLNAFLRIETLRKQLDKIHTELYVPKQLKGHDNIGAKLSFKKVDIPVRKPKPQIIKIGKWVAAASIVILLAFSTIHITSNRKTVEDRLYAAYYEPFRNNTNSFFYSTSLIEAKKQYNNKEYGVAWLLIDDLPNSVKIEAEKTLYAGLILMELERYTEAIDKFESLQTDEKQKVIHSISQWYLALCYLKTEKMADAIKLLEQIVEYKGYNHPKAKKIMKKLSCPKPGFTGACH